MTGSAREPLAADDGCPDGTWGPPPAEEPVNGEAEEGGSDDTMSCGTFVMSVGTMLLALPALVGAWCWPMVVAAVLNLGASFMNAGAGSGVVDFFHGFQVALMMTIMFNLTQFVYWRCKLSRQGSFLQVHLPTLYTLVATVLVNIQPMWILAIGSWKLCCAPCEEFQFPQGCTGTGSTFPPWTPGEYRECSMDGNVFWDHTYCTGQQYATFPTKASGWAVQILCTWGGFVFMFIGVLQATQLHRKMAKKWRDLRRGRVPARNVQRRGTQAGA